MGLDIYFWTVKRGRSRNKDINRKSEIKKIEKNTEDVIYVGDFRKVNFLMSFFNYTGNCEYIEIRKEQVEELIQNCEDVLFWRGKTISEKLLETTPGFFFGSTDYDEYYYQKVQNVLDTFKPLINPGSDTNQKPLDWNERALYMLAWW